MRVSGKDWGNHWPTVEKMVQQISSKWYLVGGQVFRRLAGHSTEQQDYDFLCFDIIRKEFPGWELTRGKLDPFGPKASSLKNKMKQSLRYEKEIVVDFISIEDFEEHTLEGYFKQVPLDIQAIAWDPEKNKISGHGLEAIKQKKITIQRLDSILSAGHKPAEYLQKKMLKGFKVGKGKHVCFCDHRDLFLKGCLCGGL